MSSQPRASQEDPPGFSRTSAFKSPDTDDISVKFPFIYIWKAAQLHTTCLENPSHRASESRQLEGTHCTRNGARVTVVSRVDVILMWAKMSLKSSFLWLKALRRYNLKQAQKIQPNPTWAGILFSRRAAAFWKSDQFESDFSKYVSTVDTPWFEVSSVLCLKKMRLMSWSDQWMMHSDRLVQSKVWTCFYGYLT